MLTSDCGVLCFKKLCSMRRKHLMVTCETGRPTLSFLFWGSLGELWRSAYFKQLFGSEELTSAHATLP